MRRSHRRLPARPGGGGGGGGPPPGGGGRRAGATPGATLHPGARGAGASGGARLDRVVFGAFDDKAGAVGSMWDLLRDRASLHHPEVTSGVRAEESQTLLREFFAAKR